MKQSSAVEPRTRPRAVADSRSQLLALIPAAERRITLSGISTAVLEGGDGPPMVLLHGPGGFAAHWMRVIPSLAATYRVIVPDLPAHGASDAGDETLDADRVLDWLSQLIDQTCETPPTLVAQLLAGAIALRFAIAYPGRLERLILQDTFGLRPLAPTPEFEVALTEYISRPTESTHDSLWRQCAFDLDAMRERMGDGWELLKAYNLDRARAAELRDAQHVLMGEFAMPMIPSADLERIRIPVTLAWGRHDLATPLHVAEAASARYGWPLHVIEDAADAPSMEQPEAFLDALGAALKS